MTTRMLALAALLAACLPAPARADTQATRQRRIQALQRQIADVKIDVGTLEKELDAPLNAALVREAAEVYLERGVVKGDG